MRYSEALGLLLALPDWERGTGSRPANEALFLERPAALLRALGNPERRYRSVLVAGTKGKGSTAAMLERILRAAGLNTGLYSSPHLHTYRERVRVGGQLITEADFASRVDELQPLLDGLVREHPEFGSFTTFEAMTVLALEHFAREKIDVAVLEVGLGGRLDATNVVDADLSIITRISFDHMSVLGNTLHKIATEKAGIIKAGKIVLTAPQAQEALEVIEHAAREKKATIGVGERDWLWLGDHTDFMVAAEPRAGLWKEYWHDAGLRVALRGVHQLENAAVAIAAAHAMRENWGWQIEAAHIAEGPASTEWAGRLEVVQERGATQALIVADAAHNGDSAEKLFEAIKFHFEFEKLFLILGVLGDKDLGALAAPFAARTEVAWAVRTGHPRSREAAELAQELNALGMEARAAVDFDDALAGARERAGPRDLILVTGSFSIVAPARAAFGLVKDQDPPL